MNGYIHEELKISGVDGEMLGIGLQNVVFFHNLVKTLAHFNDVVIVLHHTYKCLHLTENDNFSLIVSVQTLSTRVRNQIV